MKNISILYSFLLLLLITSSIHSQWQNDVRLTNDTAETSTTNNNVRTIASNGDTVHVVFNDKRDGNYEIYYKRSTNGGNDWLDDFRLTNSIGHSVSSSIAVEGLYVHVAWCDWRDGNPEIYYKRSTDAGNTWESDVRLTVNSAESYSPCIAVYNSIIHVMWDDKRDGNTQIYYKRSSNNGVTWESDVRITNVTFDSFSASVFAIGQFVHVAWVDNRDGNAEIYYKRSSNTGIIWDTDKRLTNFSAISYNPSISVSNELVGIVWYDSRNTTEEIYYKASTNTGITWSSDIRLTNNNWQSLNPCIRISGNNIHVFWTEEINHGEVFYKRSTNQGLSWDEDTRLTYISSNKFCPSATVSGTNLHVIWVDKRDGNYEIYYKRNPTGNPIGIKPISEKIPETYSLSQNYPNPFNPSTTIEFDIPATTYTKLTVYGISGKELKVLVNEELKAGRYRINFDGSNLSSGVYFYKLETIELSLSRKMIFIK